MAQQNDAVPASELARNFGRYRVLAQSKAVPVSDHGELAGYFVRPEDYEELKRYRQARRSFATVDLPPETVQAIAASRMDARHAHLDAVLDPP